MTTTKEDQIHAAFKLCDEATDWETYKACAESYEKKLADKEAEIVKQIGLKKDYEQRNVTLEAQMAALAKKLSEANARNAMLESKVCIAAEWLSRKYYANALIVLEQAITANSESVAVWEAENQDNAALATELWATAQAPTSTIGIEGVVELLLPAIETYEREVQAKAVTKLATEWLPHMKRKDFTSSANQTLHNLAVDDCIKHALAYATELRAANKGKE